MSKLSKQRYTVSEVIDIITNAGSDDDNDLGSFEDDEVPELILFTPIKHPEAKTDCDSDASDDLNEGLVNHMPRRILTTQYLSNLLKTSSAGDFGEESDKNARKENVDDEEDRETTKKRGKNIQKESKQDRNTKRKQTKSNINYSPQAQEIEPLSDHLK